MSYIIYKATTIKGKSYIGYSSKSLRIRKQKHFNNANLPINRPFLDAIRKYGDTINWEVIGIYKTLEDALLAESYFIDFYQSRIDQNGYNYTSGGEGRQGPINRNKFSKKVIDENGNIFNSLSEAGRSVNARGSDVKIGIQNKSIVKGVSFSFYKEGMIKSEKYIDKRFKPIICHQNKKIYKTCKEAALDLDLKNPATIHKVASKKRKQYRKYTFDFITKGDLSQY